jgi:hypothetical protein
MVFNNFSIAAESMAVDGIGERQAIRHQLLKIGMFRSC